MPTSLAMMLADAALSPVSMDSRLTPRERRRSNDSFALARGMSFITIRAASLPLMDTNVAISSAASGVVNTSAGFVGTPCSPSVT